MSRFFGPVGFVFSKEINEGSGIWELVPNEVNYRGEVTKNVKRWEKGDGLNSDINVSNTISIVADPYAFDNLFAVRYVKWLGHYWEITNAEVQDRRIVLGIGGVYNGPTVASSSEVGEHPRIN